MRAFTNMSKFVNTKLWCVLFSITLMFSFFTPAALAFADETVTEDTVTVVASGNCGLATDGSIDTSVQWELTPTTVWLWGYDLRIFGNGTMCSRSQLERLDHSWIDYLENIMALDVEEGVAFPADSSCLFADMSALDIADVSRADTSKVTNMTGMFDHNERMGLDGIDLSAWNVSNVTSMDGMFDSCSSLQTVDATGWNTSKLKDIGCMFRGCTKLTEIKGINDWDLSNVTGTDSGAESSSSIFGPFYGCTNLQGVDYSRFDEALQRTHLTVLSSEIMYRLYNPNSGEHFYTSSEVELQNLTSLGWKNEGVGWRAPLAGSPIAKNPVYRLYNPNAGEHHYTLSAAERDMLVNAGWRYESIGWYSTSEEIVVDEISGITTGGVRVYREYNPNAYANNHNYTTSKGEHDYLVSIGWEDEGIGWYASSVL